MKISQIVRALESIAPPELAAEWDNVGLLVGDPAAQASRLLLCIDLTEPVLAEALAARAGMVMAYHPVIFKPLYRLTPGAAPAVYGAARRGLAVYSMHTALDAAPGGTNDVLAEAMGLSDCRPLEPAVCEDQCKIVVFTPPDDLHRLADMAFAAGAGRIGNYDECAFFCHGIASFRGGRGSHPRVGRAGRHEATEELRLEIIAPRACAAAVCAALRAAHSYEEPAIDVYPIRRLPPGCGMGRIGRLRRPTTVKAMIARLKKSLGLSDMLLAAAGHPTGRAPTAGRKAGDGQGAMVATAACYAGSCDESFRAAMAGGASLLVTGEMRHHDALEAAASGMTVLCLGHSNSERLALRNLAARLSAILPQVRALLSRHDRDPFRVV